MCIVYISITMNDTSCVFEIIYTTITNGDTKLSIARMCDIAGVSHSGYYAWVKAIPFREAQEAQDKQWS
ncbi:MAG: hypothetical protein ACK5ML_12445 [Lachnospiraceae bacterium]